MSRLKLSATPSVVFLLLLPLLGVLSAGASAPGSAVATASQEAKSPEFIDRIRFLGNRRVPAATLRGRIFTKAGDLYDPDALRRDFMSLWNAGFFEDIRVEVEDSEKGKIILFHVQEKPTVRTLEYTGIKSVTVSEILDRFRERRVSLTPQSQYRPYSGATGRGGAERVSGRARPPVREGSGRAQEGAAQLGAAGIRG